MALTADPNLPVLRVIVRVKGITTSLDRVLASRSQGNHRCMPDACYTLLVADILC